MISNATDLAEARRDGTLDPLYMPCGGTAEFDWGSMCAHRCTTCNAVVGSMGMPRSCKAEQEKYEAWEKLGGVGWNYKLGQPKKKFAKA